MDTIELLKENADSVEISKTSKGEFSWKIKVYGDSKTGDGRVEMFKRMAIMKEDVENLAK
jgi:hypothetical protein